MDRCSIQWPQRPDFVGKKDLVFYYSKNLLQIWLRYKKFISFCLHFAMFVPSALNIVCRVHISKIAMNPNIICQDPEDYILRRRYLNNPNLRKWIHKIMEIFQNFENQKIVIFPLPANLVFEGNKLTTRESRGLIDAIIMKVSV